MDLIHDLIHRLWMKVHQGALIPWRCVLTGHVILPVLIDGSMICVRQGCTHEEVPA